MTRWYTFILPLLALSLGACESSTKVERDPASESKSKKKKKKKKGKKKSGGKKKKKKGKKKKSDKAKPTKTAAPIPTASVAPVPPAASGGRRADCASESILGDAGPHRGRHHRQGRSRATACSTTATCSRR